METQSGKRDLADLKRTFEGLLNRYDMGQELEPLSEQEFVDAAINFANDGNIPEAWSSLVFGVKVPWKFQPTVFSPFESERESFRSSLSEIASGNQLSNPSAVTESAGHMLLIPRADLSGRKLRVTYWYLPGDFPAALAYVLLLFVDETKGYGRNLRQCQLERCQKFFLVQRQPTGRPRTTYCSGKHMEEFHNAGAPQRVRNSRAKRRGSSKRK